MEPYEYFTHFAEPEGGTRREWVRYRVGRILVAPFSLALNIVEPIEGWLYRRHDRITNWSERA